MSEHTDNPKQLNNIIDNIFESEDVRRAALQGDNPLHRSIARLSDKASQPQLAPTAKANMLQQVLDSVNPTPSVPKVKPHANVIRPTFWTYLAKAAAGFVVAMVVAGLVAVPASADSLPGDTLYPVKRQVEAVQRVMALSPESRAEIYLSQAQTRLEELQQLVEQDEFEESLLDDGFDSINESITIALENDLYDADLGLLVQTDTALNAYGEALSALERNPLIGDALISQWQESQILAGQRINDVGTSNIPPDFGCGRPGNVCNAPGQTNENGNGNANGNSNGNPNGNPNGNSNGNGNGNRNGNTNGNGRGRP